MPYFVLCYPNSKSRTLGVPAIEEGRPGGGRGREAQVRRLAFLDHGRRYREKYRPVLSASSSASQSVSRLRSPIEACAVLIRDTHGLFARGTIADPFFMLAPSRVTTLVKLQKPKANRSGDGP